MNNSINEYKEKNKIINMKIQCYIGLGTTYILYLSGFYYITNKIIHKDNYNIDLFLRQMKSSVYLSIFSCPIIGLFIHKIYKKIN